MKTTRPTADQFAAATDALLRDTALSPVAADQFHGELAFAARLRSTSPAGIPDPVFVEGLRRELRARVSARAARETASTVRYSTMQTPIGRLALAYRDGRVLYCTRLDEPRAPAAEAAPTFERAVASALGVRPEREDAPPPGIERGVREHLAGRRRFREVDISWLTPFQRRVLEKTSEIPRGEVRPYGWVAREIGAPGAVRAVGTALGHNPVPFIIPCHRVVRSDGSLGEYSGGGPAMKVKVLEMEGAPVETILAGAARGERYRASRTTHIVCYPSCHAARRIKPENAVPFASFAGARESGYRPCELCRPA